jgi:hypothetical protein
MDYVSDLMKCIALRVRECDTALIDMRVPPDIEKFWYLTFEVLAVVLITTKSFLTLDVLSIHSYRHLPGVCCLHLYDPQSQIIPFCLDCHECINLLWNVDKCVDMLAYDVQDCLLCIRYFVFCMRTQRDLQDFQAYTCVQKETELFK